jgi:hypothetical protein
VFASRLVVRIAAGVAVVVLSNAAADESRLAVTLRWDYGGAGTAAGFAVYCGTSSYRYATRTDAGNSDSITMTFDPGVTNFCAVVAYDSDAYEGLLSNEIAFRVVDAAQGVVRVEPPLSLASDEDPVTVTATGYKLRFNRRFNPQSLKLFGWDSDPSRGGGISLSGANSGLVSGSVAVDGDGQGFTFVRSGGVLPPDTYTLAIAGGWDSVADEFGRPFDGNGDGVFGDGYAVSFVVPAVAATVLSIGEFARGPGQAVHLPPSDRMAGIPVRIINGAAATDVEFDLKYSPHHLILRGIRPGTGLTGRLSVATLDQDLGLAHVRIEGLHDLPATGTELLRLDADVPASAPYRGTHVLDISNLQINGGSLFARDDDGLHVVAYLGDTTGNGTYSSLDLARLQGLTTGADSTLAAYPSVDPRLIGDITGNGAITSLDLARLSEWIRSGLNASVRPEFEPMP